MIWSKHNSDSELYHEYSDGEWRYLNREDQEVFLHMLEKKEDIRIIGTVTYQIKEEQFFDELGGLLFFSGIDER